MKRTFTILASIAIAISLSVSCTDLSEIEKRIDSVENQLEALQTQVSQLNNNAELLQALKDAKTIKEIKKENGVTTITLSNGDTYTISDGANGTNGEPGSTPQLTIDDKGYWSVSYDGTTWTKLENKATPEFSMKDGYWMVRYSKNDEFTQLLDPSGNPIAVTGGGGIAFDWEVVNGVFRMTLPNPDGGEDRIVELPIVGNEFSVTFDTNSLSPVEGQENIYQIEEGAELAVPVTIKGLVGNKFEITAPAGWTVALDNNDDTDNETFKLLVTGHNVATKAVVGSTATDVVLKIFSDTYGTAMDKIRFELVGSIVATPAISKVEFIGTENNGLKFNVDFRSATGYKYLLYAEGATAPAVETLKAADSSTEKILNLTEYTDGTEKKPLEISATYTLYVLAYADDDVYENTLTPKSANGTFDDPSITGFYREYMLGNDITIAGKTINKATYGPAKLVKENIVLKNLENTYVYFVQAGKTIDYNLVQVADQTKEDSFKDLIIIGNDEEKGNLNVISRFIVQKNNSATRSPIVLFDNMNIDATQYNNYTITSYYTGEYLPELVFNKCNITASNNADFISLSQSGEDQRGIKNLTMTGCDYKISTPAIQTKTLFLLNSKTTIGIDNISFTDNVFYCSTPEPQNMRFRLVDTQNEKINSITFKDNTVVELLTDGFGTPGTALFASLDLEALEVSNNILYSTTFTKGGYFYRSYNSSYDYTAIKESTSASFNKTTIYYYAPKGQNWLAIYGTNANEYDGKLVIYKKTDSPFETVDVENGKFVKTAACTVGAQR